MKEKQPQPSTQQIQYQKRRPPVKKMKVMEWGEYENGENMRMLHGKWPGELLLWMGMWYNS